MWTMTVDIHLYGPRASFALVLVADKLADDGRAFSQLAQLQTVLADWWKGLQEPMPVAEATWAVWSQVTDWLLATRQCKRVQCVRVMTEPTPGFVVTFEPTEDTYEEYNNE